MGGVDLNDKMAKLDKSRKSYKWYTRLDRKCFQWALYNAYVIYKCQVVNPVEFRKFALEVFTDILDRKSFLRKQNPKTMPDELRFSRDELHCPVWPADGSTNHRCVVCEKKFQLERDSKPGQHYSQLMHKSVKTSVHCSVCSVYLCVKRGSTCFADYHSKVQFWRWYALSYYNIVMWNIIFLYSFGLSKAAELKKIAMHTLWILYHALFRYIAFTYDVDIWHYILLSYMSSFIVVCTFHMDSYSFYTFLQSFHTMFVQLWILWQGFSNHFVIVVCE